jgi:hypothetical protein
MILCQFSFATNDAMVKYVYQSYNEIFVLNQIIFLRGIFALFFIGLFLFFKKKLDFKIIFSSSQLTIRGLLESFAAICFFIGVATLPIWYGLRIIKPCTNYFNNLWSFISK